MKTYTFDVTQEFSSFYTGNISIEAKNEKEALELIKSLNNEELDELVEDWEISLESANILQPIEVFNKKGKLIHQPDSFQ